MTSRIEQAYRALQSVAGDTYLEPRCDVERVNELRQRFRPRRTKLVVIGESHVRRKTGPGFIYDAGYYTPWWRDLLWPAFGGRNLSRADNLESLRDRGVWLLDMSIIALSGYRNICRDWPARPLDHLSPVIFAISWESFVQSEYEQVGSAHLVYFERAAQMIPDSARRNGTPLRFNSPRAASSLRYSDPSYAFGTARFVDAVRKAGL